MTFKGRLTQHSHFTRVRRFKLSLKNAAPPQKHCILRGSKFSSNCDDAEWSRKVLQRRVFIDKSEHVEVETHLFYSIYVKWVSESTVFGEGFAWVTFHFKYVFV